MGMVDSSWGAFVAFIVFLSGLFVSVFVGAKFGAGRARSVFIYLWHSIFCVVYCVYVLTYGGDAVDYYYKASHGLVGFEVGTAAVEYFTAMLVQWFGLSLLATFFVYNVFGVIGMLAFDAALRFATAGKSRNVRRLATLVIFLPSISFWSSAIGKDSLSFMSVALALWAALDLPRRPFLMGVAVVVMLLVRPHMAGAMLFGLSVAFFMEDNSSVLRKAILILVALAAILPLAPFVLSYAGLGDASNADDLVSYVEKRQSYNMEGGGGIDISEMSLPMKLFTYLFRPVIFEADNLFSFAAAVDNFFLLYIFLVGGLYFLRGRSARLLGGRMFMWAYSSLSWLVLAMTTANLGIALRQKWMFAPMLIFLFISLVGKDVSASATQISRGRRPRFRLR